MVSKEGDDLGFLQVSLTCSDFIVNSHLRMNASFIIKWELTMKDAFIQNFVRWKVVYQATIARSSLLFELYSPSLLVQSGHVQSSSM